MGAGHRDKDEIIIKKIQKGEILKNDKRFEKYRREEHKNKPVAIPLTASDDEWLQETVIGRWAVIEKLRS